MGFRSVSGWGVEKGRVGGNEGVGGRLVVFLGGRGESGRLRKVEGLGCVGEEGRVVEV